MKRKENHYYTEYSLDGFDEIYKFLVPDDKPFKVPGILGNELHAFLQIVLSYQMMNGV